jgi:hypothetical protein
MQTLMSWGTIIFTRFRWGEYFVKAGPGKEDPYYDKYSFTYYPNQIDPYLADTIFLKEDGWEYDIDLVLLDFKDYNTGEGNISGQLHFADERIFDFTSVNILLLDASNNALTHLQATNTGHFAFEKLINGSYILFPRIDGFKTEAIPITISESQPDFDNLSLTIHDGTISKTEHISSADEQSILLYPNPANELINISYNNSLKTSFLLQVRDLSGKIIWNKNKQYDAVFVDQITTSDWESGFYVLEIITNDKLIKSQKFVVYN